LLNDALAGVLQLTYFPLARSAMKKAWRLRTRTLG
jgi:hypothetical protein